MMNLAFMPQPIRELPWRMIVPVVLIYVFFSEKLIQGMTAGAVK